MQSRSNVSLFLFPTFSNNIKLRQTTQYTKLTLASKLRKRNYLDSQPFHFSSFLPFQHFFLLTVFKNCLESCPPSRECYGPFLHLRNLLFLHSLSFIPRIKFQKKMKHNFCEENIELILSIR